MNCSRALPVLCCGAGSLTAGGGRRDTAPPTGLVTPNKLVSQSDQQVRQNPLYFETLNELPRCQPLSMVAGGKDSLDNPRIYGEQEGLAAQ